MPVPAMNLPDVRSLSYCGGCLLAILLAGCQHGEAPATTGATKSAAPKDQTPLKAELVTVQPRPWRTAVRSQGQLVADEASIVGAKVAGRVASVSVDLGDFVHQGDVLAQLDESELQLQLKQAAAQLAQARAAVGLSPDQADDAVNREKSPVVRQERAIQIEAQANLARLKQLQERNAVTQADLETSAAALAVAEARYASALNAVEEKLATIQVRRAEYLLAQDRLQQAVIRAPFDGLIQMRQAAPGTYLGVGDAVCTLVRTDPLRYRGTVSERYALSLREGQEVLVELDGLPEPISTRISRISPVLEDFSRALIFEAVLPNPDGRLRSGLFAEAEVVVDTHAEALAVPESAVIEFAGVEKVWKVDSGAASEVPVQTGRRERGMIEIVSGLQAGDAVIRTGTEGRSGPVVSPTVTENMGG